MKADFREDFEPVWKKFLEFQNRCTGWAERVMLGAWSEEVREQYGRIEEQKHELDADILKLRKYEQVVELPGGGKMTLKNPWLGWVNFVSQSLMIRASDLYSYFLRAHQKEAFPVSEHPLKSENLLC